MNKEEIKKITSQLKEILNKYPDKQHEMLLYVFGRDNLMRMINEPTYEQLQQENKQLKDQLSKQNRLYLKVFEKCEEMILNRFYMNDIAIKKYATEIKDIIKYYIPDPEWQEIGSDSNE